MFSFFQNFFKKDDLKNCKYLIVPDIHGTYSVLKKVIEFIKMECEEDRVIIFLGDYMDRGESGEVYGREFLDAGSFHSLKALFALEKWAKKESRELHFLRGNHEIFFEDHFLKDRSYAYDTYPFFRESVDALEFAFQNDYTLFAKFEEFLENLLPYYLDKDNGYLFVHAGVDFRVGTLEHQAEKGVIYWIREKFFYNDETLPFKVVFGHTPFDEVFIREDKIGLDSGIYNNFFINLLKIDGKNHKIIKL